MPILQELLQFSNVFVLQKDLLFWVEVQLLLGCDFGICYDYFWRAFLCVKVDGNGIAWIIFSWEMLNLENVSSWQKKQKGWKKKEGWKKKKKGWKGMMNFQGRNGRALEGERAP